MMKGFLFHRWIVVLLQIVLILGLTLVTPQSDASEETVLIIKSSENSFFDTTVEQLINQTQSEVKFLIKTLDAVKKDEALLNQSKFVITLGIDAANFSLNGSRSHQVIHSYITNFQYLEHKTYPQHKNHYSILLEQPLERYLDFIKQLTNLNKVGLVINKKNKINTRTINRYSSTFNIKLEQHLFEKDDNPLNKIKQLLQSNDVLLSLPNPQVYNRQTLKGILLTSYRQNKPVISYSPAHVKSGALAAIFSSPENIGNQIAGLLNNLLNDNQFKAENYYYAENFDIIINHRVAKSLGLKIPDKDQILKNMKLSGLSK